MKLYNIRMLPCPFCGSNKLSLNGGSGSSFVKCTECGAQGSSIKVAVYAENIDEVNAIKLWNLRLGDKK
jgi:Lar family restriction alleviation protein